HVDVGTERVAGARLVLVDDIDRDGDEGFRLLVEQRQAPGLARHPRTEVAEPRVDRLQPGQQAGIIQDRILWHHDQTPLEERVLRRKRLSDYPSRVRIWPSSSCGAKTSR